jgi:TPR repeat protein
MARIGIPLVMLAAWTQVGWAAEPARVAERRSDLVVTGTPGAEAPRSSTCERLARDSYFAGLFSATAGNDLLTPLPYLPTRFPRSPDYNAPPLTPEGSALPGLPATRFGVRALVTNIASDVSVSSLDAVVDACRGAYMRGGRTDTMAMGRMGTMIADGAAGQPTFSGPTSPPVPGRVEIARSDATLPMAFALFDQGRYREALDWFEKAQRKLQWNEGGDEAALFIGKIRLQGLKDQSDPVEAVKWLKKAATVAFDPTKDMPMFMPEQPERNTAAGEAAIILANIYLNGFGSIAKDPAEARRWLERAQDVGHVPAAKRLGDLYRDGIGGPRDIGKAVACYRQAAKLDLASAQYALGSILIDGADGVKADKKEALGWLQAAARHDHGGALYLLGRAYDLGNGVPVDQQRALAFYKNAAMRGEPAAMVAMGTYFYEGGILPKDAAMARRWFQEGAQRADADGMFNLAAMMIRGEGGAADRDQAVVWMQRAAGLGHDKAALALTSLQQTRTN